MRNRRKFLSPAVQAHVDQIGAELAGRWLNIYGCDTCGGVFVTVDCDRGVTPMYLNCWATEGCPGTAGSALYPASLTLATTRPPATLEWYRPDTLGGLSLSEREHVESGGLLARPAETAPLWVKTEHWARG